MRYRTALANLLAGLITRLSLLILWHGAQWQIGLAAAVLTTLYGARKPPRRPRAEIRCREGEIRLGLPYAEREQ